MDPEAALQRARGGDAAAVGELLERYRAYLRLLARVQIGRRLQGKLDASDLVQDTLLDAHRQFPRFEGDDERRLAAWLRRILAGKVANLVRHYVGTAARDVRLEEDLARDVDRSSEDLARDFAASLASPSQQALRREQSVLLADALDRLPPDYKEVLVLRHLEGLGFPEVARQMGKSLDSVDKLWVRALAQLRKAFAP